MAESLPGSVAGWLGRVREWRRSRRVRRAIAGTRLFDTGWYRQAYGLGPDDDALGHYLVGPPERRPSPWFDGAWYLGKFPDVGASGLHPLAHYVLFGAREGRDPNPAFAGAWYLATHPEAAASPTPLDHYLSVGAGELFDPSPAFDAIWYAAAHMQGDGEGRDLDPLGHFLLVGRKAGARTQPGYGASAGEPLEAARLEALKPVRGTRGRHVAVVVARVLEGRLAPAVANFVETLAAADVAAVLLVETDAPFAPRPELTERLAGGYVRERSGGRHAAWTHLLRAEPLLFAGRSLSILGEECAPLLRPADLAGLIRRIDASDADVLAAPAPEGRRPGGQLLVFRPRALGSGALLAFLGGVTSVAESERAVRTRFETQLAGAIQGSGLRLELLEGLRPPAPQEEDGACGVPAGGPLIPAAAAPEPEPPLKVAFLGPWNYATGLSQASRGYISALWRTGARLNLHPIETEFHVHTRATPTVAVRDFEGAADVAIVHLNPDAWGALTPLQRAVIDRAGVRIGVWVWEMGHVPDSWRREFGSVDEIWTPSRYCAEVFAAQTSRPVCVVPHVVPAPPASEAAGRTVLLADLGLEPDARLILYAFDGASYIERKNPQALVRAFAATDLAERGWRVVLKTKNLMDQPRHGAALAALVAATPGVRLLEKQLGQDALGALYEAADIYASPHRSEGFGLTVAEAMARGKPVVASDYGGVRDFLDAGCGYPVPVRSVRLDEELGAYPKGGYWGEVDEAAFAQALTDCARRLEAGDRSVGERARARVLEQLSAEAVAAAMTQALAAALARRTGEATGAAA